MAEVKWTKQQKLAIEEKGQNILVAAAAGSGKTAVLVERIIHKVIEEEIDIDKLLVVTFTNAAASEMRERVLDAIYQKIEEDPFNENLQRQIILLNKSNISTIHAFCLEVIKNNFFAISISPNFRIGDTAEIELLKQETIEELFEECYIAGTEEFVKLINIYCGYKGDERLKEIILEIYQYIQSSPFPKEWLEEQVEKFNLESQLERDFSKTIWGKLLLKEFKEEIEDCLHTIKGVLNKTNCYEELKKVSEVLQDDIGQFEKVLKASNLWQQAYEVSHTIQFKTWPRTKEVTLELKDIAKGIRDRVKKKFTSVRDRIMIDSSENANRDMNEMYEILKEMKEILFSFDLKYQMKKKEKNLIDFNDIEHYALQILVKKDENGNYLPTEIAKKYQEKFEEIAIDEYQDSNLVQEYILSTISKGNNIFMVGDVKQSIYKFRQARPELFLEKYEKYEKKEKKEITEKGLRIQLFKNFRSRNNILEVTNLVFQSIMSKELGDIAYTKEEYLNLGANYEELEEKKKHAGKAELHIIDLKKQEIEESVETEQEVERIENVELEAKFVARRIKDLLEEEYYVWDKKQGYRTITYKDIVILLRATSNVASIYEKEISKLNYPVFSDTSSEYLDSIEIQTVLAILRIIDNPMQDIPLVTVMRSYVGGFSDNDLIEIRLADKTNYFYECLLRAQMQVSEQLKKKIERFLAQIEHWRQLQENMPLDELIWQIYMDSGYYQYVSLMPNGEVRQANLKMLFERAKQYEEASFKGVFNFIRFIDKLRTSSGDLSAAKLIGENENVIRIMSIHKSKGLEFPVVFLCGTGKQFNMRDLNNTILLHQEIGLGPQYINYERKIEYSTAAKEAIRNVSKIENLSEEMRVLYVALTRSKEKLIVTGISKDTQKELEEKQDLLNSYETNGKINPFILRKYKSYLDWLELVYLANKEKAQELIEVSYHNKETLVKKLGNNHEEITIQMKPIKGKDNKQVDQLLSWSYPYLASTTVPTKTSVTKLKQLASPQRQELNNIKPSFMQEVEQEITNAEKGTIMHLCLQKLDFNKNYTKESIEELLQNLINKKIITTKQAETIAIGKLQRFTQSQVFQRIQKAKTVKKEVPFYTNIPAKTIYHKEVPENILVQGIIDLYFIDQYDQTVLLDYKTDYVKPNAENDLIKKYKPQLALYKKALEETLEKEVKEVYIYSLYLEKLLPVLFE